MIDGHDLDRYYTTPEIAGELVSLVELPETPACVIDPSCGSGNLLDAAQQRWPDVNCRGIDIDREAIRRLRQCKPRWDVHHGSLFPLRHQTRKWANAATHDVVVINPPFSMAAVKVIDVGSWSRVGGCSLAMAHILAAAQLIAPKFAMLAVLPESALYSKRDEKARAELLRRFRYVEGPTLPIHAFRKARVRSTLCAWVRSDWSAIEETAKDSPRASTNLMTVQAIRGGLPVFRATASKAGIPFVHTRDFLLLQSNQIPKKRVTAVGGSQTTGWNVLLPRVGTPSMRQILKIHFSVAVQLSDCVIALSVLTKERANAIHDLIVRDWSSFEMLYRGTAARYVRLDRLREWFRDRHVTMITERTSE